MISGITLFDCSFNKIKKEDFFYRTGHCRRSSDSKNLLALYSYQSVFPRRSVSTVVSSS